MNFGRALGLAPGPETARIRALLEEASAAASPDIVAGVGDDAAALHPPPGESLVASSDASVEGVHFRREWMTWEIVGYRATAAALSDLAAMAAHPAGILLSVALPPELGPEIAGALGRGVGQVLARTGGALLGGDLVASPGPVFLDVTVLGFAREPLRRDGARPGDEVWVTGHLGGAAAAVRDLSAGLEPHPETRRAFERPVPRIAEARWLAERAELHAGIDLSDGLTRDAAHLAQSSGVCITLDPPSIPTFESLSPVRDSAAGLQLLLAGGEDYELLVVAAPGSLAPVAPAFEVAMGVPLTKIGSVAEGRGLRVLGLPDALNFVGFDHFQDEV